MLFLPLCLAGYFLAGRLAGSRAAHVFMTAASAVFVFWGFNIAGILALAASIVFNYAFYKGIQKSSHGKVMLAAAIAVNILILFGLKYAKPISIHLQPFFETYLYGFVEKYIVIPLGISFYTFQQISFLIDAYRNEVPSCSFGDYCCYVSFFPKVLSGPIIRHEQFLPQLKDEERIRFNWENFSKGLFRFAIGLGKKVLIADMLAAPAGLVFSDPAAYTGISAVVGVLAFALQLYFDFSGYCDMAAGVASMFNFEIPENFDSPYKALNIKDFWNRWHITLTQFLTRYVYFPLGGSRKGTIRTYINIMVIFLISGLWHGSDSFKPFIVWGLMHGAAMVVYRIGHKLIDRLPRVVNRIITFVFVCIAWIPFRMPELSSAAVLIKNMFRSVTAPLSGNIALAFRLKETAFFEKAFPGMAFGAAHPWIYCAAFLVFALILVLFLNNAKNMTDKFTPSVKNLIFAAALIGWSLMSLSGVGTFIYAGF